MVATSCIEGREDRLRTRGPFEIVTIDLEKKRIGVALVPEGSSRARSAAGQTDADDANEFAVSESAKPTESFGSLADKLRGALKSR